MDRPLKWFCYLDDCTVEDACAAGRLLAQAGITGRFLSGTDDYAIMQTIASEKSIERKEGHGKCHTSRRW